MLEFGVDELDADRYERLVRERSVRAADGSPARPLALFSEAEELWRGPPLADFAYEPFAQAPSRAWRSVRINAREELIEARAGACPPADVVAELEALVREHPFRERPRGQLMLALYRWDARRDALDAFQQARRTLVEELAVEPGDALRDLEQAILRQDPSLAAPSEPGQEPGARRGQSPDGASDSAPVSTDGASAATFATTIRKIATVLVARLAAAGDTDPERARSLIAAARADVERVVAQHGGMFVLGLGGEVVGIFGVPVTKEDDALRAVRAAYELREQVAVDRVRSAPDRADRTGHGRGRGRCARRRFRRAAERGGGARAGRTQQRGAAVRRDAAAGARRRSASSPRWTALRGG